MTGGLQSGILAPPSEERNHSEHAGFPLGPAVYFSHFNFSFETLTCKETNFFLL